MRPRAEVVVAGAGPTGLGAAWGCARHSLPALLVDPRPTLGGLASTRTRGAYRYKVGIHLLHPSNDALVPLVEELCGLFGPSLHRIRPRSAIHFLGRHLAYPFRTPELLAALGPRTTLEVAASAALARLRPKRPTDGPPSFADVVRGAFGDAFYGLFFRDYTAKVLGLDPEHVAAQWAYRRVPMPTRRSLVQVLVPWYRPRRVEHAHSPFHRFQFTGPDGLDPLFEALAAGATTEVRLGASLAGVELAHGRVEAVRIANADGTVERRSTRALVATLPLPELVGLLDPPPPPAIRAAAERLEYRGLVLAYLLLAGPPVLPAQWTYFQHPSLVFNRVSEFANIVPGAFGPDRTLVCAEITAQPGDALWSTPDEALVARTREDLGRVAPAAARAEVLDGFVVREAHGYPRWTRGYEDDLAPVLGYVDDLRGLYAVGRQARYDYLNVDECIAAGRAVAGRLVEEVP